MLLCKLHSPKKNLMLFYQEAHLDIWKTLMYCDNHRKKCNDETHLGKLRSVGTWQARWKTFGHLSQHNRSPPFWHTAHQSSFGSSSLLLLLSPPTRGERCVKLRIGDFPLKVIPNCLQLPVLSEPSILTWFSMFRSPSISVSLSECKLLERGGVKLLSGLLI